MDKVLYKSVNGTVTVSVDGKIKMDFFLKLISEVTADRSLPTNLKVIIDSRKARYLTKPSDITTIYRKLRDNCNKFVSVKIAVVQISPYETAVSMILKELIDGIDNIVLEVFNTEQAALAWLNHN